MQENTDSYNRPVADGNIQPQIQSQTGHSKGTGKKWLLGCGIGCLVLVIITGLILGIGSYIAYKYAVDKVNTWSQKFEGMGFEKVKGQIIEIVDDVNHPMLYIGQSVKIMGDCQKDIAVISQICEIHGRVAGTVYFKGQILVIQPKAIIEGDLDVTAQTVEIYGQVNGQIKGSYQNLQDKKRIKAE